MQDVKEITENFIESQKAMINSFQSAWRPYQQSLNNKVNTCISQKQQLMHIVEF